MSTSWKMYCPKCGQKRESDDGFCPVCGGVLQDIQLYEDEHITRKDVSTHDSTDNNRKMPLRKKPWLIISMLLVIMGVFFVCNRDELLRFSSNSTDSSISIVSTSPAARKTAISTTPKTTKTTVKPNKTASPKPTKTATSRPNKTATPKPAQSSYFIGKTITFGSYPQSSMGNDNTPVKWRVLDVQDEKVLLISSFALDCHQYSNNEKDKTWENSTIRNWLNSSFLNNTFSNEEQDYILASFIDNSDYQGYSNAAFSGGNNTYDKIFLLSVMEATTYFKDNNDRVCPLTNYAIKKRAYASNQRTVDRQPACWWWLRSPGNSDAVPYAAGIDDDGSLGAGNYVLNELMAVRPAMWVSSKIFTRINTSSTFTIRTIAEATVRSKPTVNSSRLSTVGAGTIFTAYGRVESEDGLNDWYKISYDGGYAYVSTTKATQ